MNTLVIFTALLLAIVIFFLLYCLHYKNLIINNNQRSSQIETFQCATDINNVFYIDVDNEIQACFNNIDKLYTSTLVGNEFTLYNFDGVQSYVYGRDFLDNYFNISLVVIFKDVSKSTAQTLLETKYLLIILSGTELSVTYNHKGTNNINNIKSFSNINTTTRYQLKVEQNFNYREVYVTFDNYESFDETELNTHIFKTVPIHSCKYSSGNDFYIGCNKQKTDFLNAYIGDISFNIDKTEFDIYDTVNATLPVNLECDFVAEPTAPAFTEPAATTAIVVNPFENLQNYIIINISNIFNDLQLVYFSTNLEDHLLEVNNSYLSQINNYFESLTEKKDIISNKKAITLEKNNGYFDGYDNLNDSSTENLYYLFSLNNEKNVNILSKFGFLDLEKVKSVLETYDESYIFILGKKVYENSYYKFLNIDKVAFFIVFKNNKDTFYQFEQINISLSTYYKIQQEYLKYLINSPVKVNNLDNYIGFIDELPDQDIDPSSEILDYKRNIYRLYDSKIDFSSITVMVYKMNIVQDLLYVKYKKTLVEESCNFIPSGETKFECIQNCNNGDYFSCNDTNCKDLCNNCHNSACKWNIVDIERQKMFVPSSTKVKGFAGDKRVKLTWIKPLSSYKIDAYYIIAESELNKTRYDMYVYDGEEEMVEFVISNLNNDLPYSFYVFSKNSQGVSNVSNRVTIIPQKNKLLDMENISKQTNTFSDSLQNYYKNLEVSDYNSVVNVEKSIKNMDYLIEVNSLKDILVDKIVGSKINTLNVNIY